ncbi:P68 family surface lipoprotein [Mycoplasma marinum]|uniref:P68 family surface lipoprotein n=1 Tax=Mycoplasma marinum TaxID=1937190 RepID=UPI003B2A0ABF
MIKSKKIMTGALATMGVIAVPVISVVSCGVKGIEQYDTDNDGQIIIQTGWSATGNQKKALDLAVAEYNAQQKGTKGFMPVKVVGIEGGYGKMASTLSSKIQSKKTNGMPNLLIEYADALGIINKYKFAFDMNKTTPRLDKGLISDKFMKINSQIGGADSSGAYMVPLGKSTEMVGVNNVLLYMVLHQAGYQPGKNPKLDNIYNDVINKADATEQEKPKNWGSLKPGTQKAIVDAADDSIFDSWESLMKFSDAVAKGYGLKADGEKFVVGHDSGTNLVYSLGYLKENNDMDKFLFSKEKGGKGYVDYKLFDEKSEQNKIFKDILGELKKHVETGALKIAGGGEYTSSLMQQHGVIFSIGSSAGYSHLSTKGGMVNIMEEAKLSTGKTVSIGNFKPYKIFEKAGKLVGQASKNSHYNPIVATKDKNDKNQKYYIEVGEDAIKGINEYAKTHKEFVLLKDASDGTKASSLNLKDYKEIKGGYGVIPIGESTIIPYAKSSNESLQENEMQAFPGISKLNKDSKKTMAFAQGPSFVGIHANKPEDNATVLFLNWFYNQKSMTKTEWSGKYNVKVPAGNSIVEAFDKMSGYMTPISGFEEKLNPIFNSATQTIHTKGAQIAFNSYKEQVKSDSGSVFFTPVDDYSSSLRQTLSATIKSIFTNAHTSNGKAESVSKIYSKIKIAARTNKII